MRKWGWQILTIAFVMTLWSTSVPVQARTSNSQLIIGISQEFENLNPITSQMTASRYIYYMVGRPLVMVNADWKWACKLCTVIPTEENGLMKIVDHGGSKRLVSEWEIHQDANWGDGKPVTGHDVAFSWEVGKSPNVSVGLKETYEQIVAVEVDPKNPKKFTLVFDKPRYDYYQLGTFYIVPKHVEEPVWSKTKDSMGAYEKRTLYARNPATPGLYSGPYVVKEIKLGSHVVLSRNPHFRPQAKIEQIIVRFIPNTQTLEANILSGTINMIAELGMTFDQAISFEKRLARQPDLKSRFKVTYRKGTVYEHIDLNLENPILKDLRVRRALVYAINRQELVDSLFNGKQEVAIHQSHPLDGYFTDDVTLYPYDPKRASALLDEAGWKMGAEGVRVKDGKKLSLPFMTTADNKTRELVQVVLQQQWKKVGVEVKIKNEPARVFFGETMRKRLSPALAMYAWTSSPENPPDSTLHSKNIPTKENEWSGQNYVVWVNPKVDDALDKIKTEFRFDERKKLMKTILQEYTREVPVIPLYMRAQHVVIPTNLEGHVITGHQFDSTQDIEKWNLK